MKIIVIRKKFLTYLFVLFLILTFATYKSLETTEVFSVQKSIDKYDFNNDGQTDKITNTNNDILITVNNTDYSLNNLCNNKLNSTSSWKKKVHILDLSRDLSPEIIIQNGFNGHPLISIFNWQNNNFQSLSIMEANILGIYSYNNTRTPQCFTINSSIGQNSIRSFMLIDDKITDTTDKCNNILDLDSIIQFINLIEEDYESETLPDIFTENIPYDELVQLYHLDKEKNFYSFQDAFFYDSGITDDGAIESVIWQVNFEKYPIGGKDSDKQEVTFFITTKKNNQDYKINSFQFNN